MNKNWYWAIGLATALAFMAMWYFWVKVPENNIKNVDSFEECIKLYPVITLQYPARCTLPDGRTFVEPTPSLSPTLNIANPASVYCKAQGGTLSIIEEEPGTGGQVGMCTLPGGKVCEEWTFYRGECK